MMPTLEERRSEILRARARLFEPRDAPPDAPVPPMPLAAWEALVASWWARDRAARIRAGACSRCAERGCPSVGGRDYACVA